MDNETKVLSAVSCGACGHDNSAETKFCQGCGQNLYTPCRGCGKSVALTQKFCGSCGADLEQSVSATRQEYQKKLVDAVEAAREYEFEHAVGILTPVSVLSDYRFKDAAEKARQAIVKIKAMRARAVATAEETLARAKVEGDNGNELAVVRLLESIPPKMLGENGKKLLASTKSRVSEQSELSSALQSAMEAKNWRVVGGLVDQLLVESPDDKKYVQIAQQVSVKLIAAAKQLFSSGKYAAASERLAAVPTHGRDQQYESNQQKYEDVDWLSQQFDIEPFVTPSLGRLAVRFAKEVPENEAAQDQVRQLATRLKQADRSKRNPYPTWKGSPDCWMGGEVNVLGGATSIVVDDQKAIKANISRFHVAFGLALQGLGRGRVDEDFAPKKGLLRSIGWRKSKVCWGVDIGSAAIKAVCLEEGEGSIRAIDSYFYEFEEPTCRGGDLEESRGANSAAIEMFIEEKELASPVWVNFPANELINRFVRLPPVSDKKAVSLLETEIKQRIPLQFDDLAIVKWVGPLDNDNDANGRPVAIAAAKKSAIDSRLELLREAGLEVAGMQGDSIATVNFASHEFAELLSPEAETAERSDPQATMPTIAFLESGALATSLILVSPEAYWIWTIESGSEDLTAALARRAKMTRVEAEPLKRNPAALEHPAGEYASIEQRQKELRARIEKVFADGLRQNPRFDVVQSWCLGGGCMAHQWIRRFMLRESHD